MKIEQIANLSRSTGKLAIVIAFMTPIGVYVLGPMGPTMKPGKPGRKLISSALERHDAPVRLKELVMHGVESLGNAADKRVKKEYTIWVVLWAALCVCGATHLHIGSQLDRQPRTAPGALTAKLVALSVGASNRIGAKISVNYLSFCGHVGTLSTK